MPEYLAPGVFVEETSFRAKSIEGVSTSTTGFVGPTRKGPVNEPTVPGAETLGGVREYTPELLTSFGDFVRIYGRRVRRDTGRAELSGTRRPKLL